MATAKEIKQRLNSIKNTKKTTHAMELVAGAKMRKAVEATISSREYSKTAWQIVTDLYHRTELDPDDFLTRFFMEPAKEQHSTIVMFTSNRGLCGAFNAQVVRLVLDEIEKRGKENVTIIGIGKKGVAILNAIGIAVQQAYEKDDNARSDESIREVMAGVHKDFLEGKTDNVSIAYTDYISPIQQQAKLQKLFPFIELAQERNNHEKESLVLYEYEPTPSEVLEYMIPRIAEIVLYQSLLESNASEHSARMMAMKNATDAASDMANELNLIFNRARQAAITKEIAEIAAGTAAVT